jgi:predicted transcriptional regulator
MTNKELMHRIVDQLPDEADVDDIIERLLFIQGIERGLNDLEAGRVISHEEMLKRIESWRR